jgi:hypothetical protein
MMMQNLLASFLFKSTEQDEEKPAGVFDNHKQLRKKEYAGFLNYLSCVSRVFSRSAKG